MVYFTGAANAASSVSFLLFNFLQVLIWHSERELIQATRHPLVSSMLTPNQPLIWTESLTSSNLKRKLDIFQPSTDKACKRIGEIEATKFAKLKNFRDLFNMVGAMCGYCYLNNGPDTAHDMDDCDLAGETLQDEYDAMRLVLDYDRNKKSPCYKCHIHSFGGDALHRPMVRDENSCDWPNLVMPLAFAMYKRPQMLRKAQRAFNLRPDCWKTIEKYGKWLCTSDKEYATNAMKLMEHFFINYVNVPMLQK